MLTYTWSVHKIFQKAVKSKLFAARKMKVIRWELLVPCAMYYAIPSNNQRSIVRYYGFILPHGFIQAANIGSLWYYIYYPTLASVFQGFRVWGKFVFPTLELTVTPTNLANQVKIGHALDQSRSVQTQTWESAPKQWAVMAILAELSPTFETVLRR